MTAFVIHTARNIFAIGFSATVRASFLLLAGCLVLQVVRKFSAASRHLGSRNVAWAWVVAGACALPTAALNFRHGSGRQPTNLASNTQNEKIVGPETIEDAPATIAGTYVDVSAQMKKSGAGNTRTTTQLSAPEQDAGRTEDTSDLAWSLLQRSFESTRAFAPEERAALLVHLANAGMSNHKTEAAKWAEEAAQIAAQMPPGVERNNQQAMALMALSQADSARSLELLPSLSSAPQTGYDLRTRTASRVMAKYLNDSPDGIEKVLATIHAMEVSGAYPLMAVGTVISEAADRHKEIALLLAENAIHYYNGSPHTYARNAEYATFLGGAARVLPRPRLKLELEGLLSHLRSPEQIDRGTEVKPAMASEKAGTMSFRNLNDITVIQLLPLMRWVDPAWEKQFRQEHPTLQSEADAWEKAKGGKTLLAASSTAESASMEEAKSVVLSRVLADKAFKLADGDPSQALAVRETISDPTWRVVAGVDIAPALRESDPQQSKGLLAEAERQLKQTTDPQDKLRILAALGRTFLKMRDQEAFAEVMARIFAVGEEAFTKFSAETMKYMWAILPGMRELSYLTQASADFAPQLMMTKIQNLKNPILKSHLMVALAEGLQARKDK